MIHRKKGEIEWLEFELLQQFPEVIHAVFLRHGGVSTFPYTSLNVGGGTEDDPHAIEQNRQKILDLLDLKKLVGGYQVHGAHLETFPNSSPLLEKGCDGIVTREKEIALLIKHADCQAAIFFDPIEQVIANIHCGWRGSVQNVYAKTVEYLRGCFGCKKEHLHVCISPSLGPLAAEFIHHESELPKHFLPFQIKANFFDFWAISQMQLEEAGILANHIEIAKKCTFTEKENFFSYRREKKTGRHATVVALKSCHHCFESGM